MKELTFPHPLILLVSFILLATVLTYLIPSGLYDRTTDETTGRSVVVSGSYHEVDATPVGFYDAFVAIPKGMIEAADIIFLVFLIGGAFTVVDQTAALKNGVTWLVVNLKGKESLIIIITCLIFAAGGALNNLQEEIIALVPVLLILTNSLGFKPIVAAAISFGTSMVAASFSPVNPFQVGIAQKLAQVPLYSGSGIRLIFMGIALAIWIFWMIRFAKKNRIEVQKIEGIEHHKSDWRTSIILILVVLTFGIMVYGIKNWAWDFNEMSAAFFMMGILVGIIGKLGLSGTSKAFVKGFEEMAFAALLIGFARGIFVVLNDGQIIDTIVYAMFSPISTLPKELSAIGMMLAHTVLHIPIASQTGQAALTMPLLVPLSDLLELKTQITILAYQYGSGMSDIITPTNGALMAVLAAVNVQYDEWFRFVIKKYLILLGLGAIALIIATV